MSQDQPKQLDIPEHGAGVRAEDSLSRRRLIKAGLYAAPVLLSLKGRSALGATCESPYGFFPGIRARILHPPHVSRVKHLRATSIVAHGPQKPD